MKFERDYSSARVKGDSFGHRHGAGRAATESAENRRLRLAAGLHEYAPDEAEDTEIKLKRITGNLRPEHDTGDFSEVKVSRVKTSGQQRISNGGGFIDVGRFKNHRRRRDSAYEKVSPLGARQSQQPGEGTGSAAARRVTRSQLQRSAEEQRAGGPKQEELQLNSSTFALTGDSSHNQAMVHWSGQNSSVSNELCSLQASLI